MVSLGPKQWEAAQCTQVWNEITSVALICIFDFHSRDQVEVAFNHYDEVLVMCDKEFAIPKLKIFLKEDNCPSDEGEV